MMTMIIGGSGSGKSSYAESYIQSVSEGLKQYYLATMQVYGEEGKRKVERHRAMRKDKGFTTIEQQTSVVQALKNIENPAMSTALLECISNLTANEMFSESGQKSAEEVAKTVVDDMIVLKDHLAHLVIVSNNVFEDGILYDESTMEYIRAMGLINVKLAMLADEVTEVVVGIPVTGKKGS